MKKRLFFISAVVASISYIVGYKQGLARGRVLGFVDGVAAEQEVAKLIIHRREQRIPKFGDQPFNPWS